MCLKTADINLSITFLESGGGSANATASSSLDKDVDDESGCSVASAAKSGSAESVHHQHGSGGKLGQIIFTETINYTKFFDCWYIQVAIHQYSREQRQFVLGQRPRGSQPRN